MLYLNEIDIYFESELGSNLTLTSVVFEFDVFTFCCKPCYNLTLTSVVFEFGKWSSVFEYIFDLTLTSVVFE